MNINELPLEIYTEIFQHLSPEELLKCTWVCNRWKTAASSEILWNKVLSEHGLDYIKTNQETAETSCTAIQNFIKHTKLARLWRKRIFDETKHEWKDATTWDDENCNIFIHCLGHKVMLAFSFGKIEIWNTELNLKRLLVFQHHGKIESIHLFKDVFLVCEDKKVVVYNWDGISYIHEYNFEQSVQASEGSNRLAVASMHKITIIEINNIMDTTDLLVPEQCYSSDISNYKFIQPVVITDNYVYGCSVQKSKTAWLICWNLLNKAVKWVKRLCERMPKLWCSKKNILYWCDRWGVEITIAKGSTGQIVKTIQIIDDNCYADEWELAINFNKNILVACSSSVEEIIMYNLSNFDIIWRGYHEQNDDCVLYKLLFHSDFLYVISWDAVHLWDIKKDKMSHIMCMSYPPFICDILIKDEYIMISSSCTQTKLFRLTTFHNFLN